MDKKKFTFKCWKLIDHVFFGDSNPKNYLSEDALKTYQILKSSLLSECITMYKYILPEEKVMTLFSEDISTIISKANTLTESIMKKETMQTYIREKIVEKVRSLNESANTDLIIKKETAKYTLSLFLDNLLLSEVLNKCDNLAVLKEDPLFLIVKSSYDMFKEELVHTILNMDKDATKK